VQWIELARRARATAESHHGSLIFSSSCRSSVSGSRSELWGRRQPVARRVPVARSADDEILDRLAARGVLQRGIGKPVPKPIRPRKTRRRLSDLVIEDSG